MLHHFFLLPQQISQLHRPIPPGAIHRRPTIQTPRIPLELHIRLLYPLLYSHEERPVLAKPLARQLKWLSHSADFYLETSQSRRVLEGTKEHVHLLSRDRFSPDNWLRNRQFFDLRHRVLSDAFEEGGCDVDTKDLEVLARAHLTQCLGAHLAADT